MGEILDYLKEYTTPSKPGSFSGQTTFIRELKNRNKNIEIKDVIDFLSNEETYTLHKNSQKKFTRNKIIVSGIDDTFQADLIDVSSIKEFNDDNRFILSCIDVFSKYAWAIPIKSKTAKDVLEAFKEIFKDNRIPERLQTDEGNEFLNKSLKTFLSSFKKPIKHYILNSEMKACIVERFNRTLKEKMWRYFTYKRTYRYIDILQDLLYSYNNSYHRTIKTRPVNVTKENETEIWKNTYHYDRNEVNPTDISFKFKEGDLVRISKSKKFFDKGYTPNWTREIFRIHQKIARVPPVYKIIDIHPTTPEVIKGIFYEKQLQKISKKDDIYYVEKILKEQIKNGKKQAYVKWLGYSDKFNSWEPITNFKSIVDLNIPTINKSTNDENIENFETIKKDKRVEFSI